MVVLLMVLTFAALIAADFMLNRERYRLPEDAEKPAPEPILSARVAANPPTPALDTSWVQGLAIPNTVHFHPGHTWVAQAGQGEVKIGIDSLAARILEAPEKIDTPRLARWVRQGARGFSLTADGRVADFLSPVDGEVLEVNPALAEQPDLVKSDPYGRGWLMRVRTPDLVTNLRNLIDQSLAPVWMEDSLAKLRLLITPAGPELAGRTALEGGPLRESLTRGMDAESWKKLKAGIFRS